MKIIKKNHKYFSFFVAGVSLNIHQMIMSTSMMTPDTGTISTMTRSFYSDTALSVLVKGKA